MHTHGAKSVEEKNRKTLNTLKTKKTKKNSRLERDKNVTTERGEKVVSKTGRWWPTPSALNMLPAFAAEHRRLQHGARSYPSISAGAQQQTPGRRCCCSIDGTAGWMDGHPTGA